MKIKKRIYSLIPALLIAVMIVAGVFSCKSVLQAKRMKDCRFDFQSFSNVRVAGINIDGVNKLLDLSLFEGAQIAAKFMSGDLPLDAVVNIAVSNPNKRMAAVNGLDWIVLVENTELARGKVTKRFEIAPGDKSMIPIDIKIDLSSALKSKDKGTLMNFAFGLSGKSNTLPSNVTIKVKPYLSIAGANVKVPGYITVKKNLTNNK